MAPTRRAPDARGDAVGAELAEIAAALEELEEWALLAIGDLGEGEALSQAFAAVWHTSGARMAIGRGDVRQATAAAFQAALAGFKALAELDALRGHQARRWRIEGGRVRAAQVEAERRPHWDRWLSMAADLEKRLRGQRAPGTRAVARWIAMELRRERGETIPVATIRGVLRRKGKR